MDNNLNPPVFSGSSFLNNGWFDDVYFAIKHYPQNRSGNRFFRYGWGNMDAVNAVRDSFLSKKCVDQIQVTWFHDWRHDSGCYIRDGCFETPRYRQYIGKEVQAACFRAVMPSPSLKHPICLHLATTGEEGFNVRFKTMAQPLVNQRIGTIMLEHPFMGVRRPSGRSTSRFHYFSELVLFGGIVVEEARALVTWLQTHEATQVGLFGISSGGHLAALAACELPSLDSVVPCLAPHSGVVAFTEGLLHRSCDWKVLGEEASCSPEEARIIAKDYLTFTGVESLHPPAPTTKICAVSALHDRFVPRYSTEALLSHWPSAEVRWVHGGHVSAILFQIKKFRQAVIDMLGQKGSL